MPSISRAAQSKTASFIDAATNGDLVAVLSALADPRVDVNAVDSCKWTALKRACENGHTAVVDALLRAPRIDVNAPDRNWWSTLMSAAFNKHVEVVQRLLLAPGVNVNMRNNSGMTALSLAVAADSPACVHALLAYRDASGNGVDVNLANDKTWTPLMSAAAGGQLDIVRQLLTARGIDLFATNRKGATAHAIAMEHHHPEIAELLHAAEVAETATAAAAALAATTGAALAAGAKSVAPSPATARDARPTAAIGTAIPVAMHEHLRKHTRLVPAVQRAQPAHTVTMRAPATLEGSCSDAGSRASSVGSCAHSRESASGTPTKASGDMLAQSTSANVTRHASGQK